MYVGSVVGSVIKLSLISFVKLSLKCKSAQTAQLYCCSAQLYSCTAVVLLIDCSLTAQLYSCTAVVLLIDCSLSSV
jgi:hypothetical protein